MIRVASPNDAAAIAAVHVHGWQAAYRGYLSDELLDRLDTAERARRWASWLADPTLGTALYETADGVVGFVGTGPSRDAGASGATGEVQSLYVEPKFWRRGVGTALMDWAVGTACTRRWTVMTLWTLADNAGARAFYERCGWVADGAAKQEPFAGTVLAQVRYAKAVDG